MFGACRRTNYKIIDGEHEEESVPRESNLEDGGLPPQAHEIVNVSFSNDKDLLKLKQCHRWDHIKNVDQFFTLVYEYHQGNGFTCIALRQAFAFFQFIFVICFSTFLLQCVDYNVLFNNQNSPIRNKTFTQKRHLNDAIIFQCAKSFHPLIISALTLAACFCFWQLICICYHLLQLREMKVFYTTALEIPDSDLSNITWQDVVTKLCNLQPKLHLIINQDNITILDVYHRILRFKNYFVALFYHDLLPARITCPFFGSFYFFSSGFRLNLEWLFFWGPWAPWKNSYSLKDEYKDYDKLELLAEQMRRTVFWISLINLILFPFVFIYQILFHFFSYADSIKREPGFFGIRKYCNYGKEKLRHFNELDHELHSRLNKSYNFAVRYIDQFLSPSVEIISKTIAFIAGSIFAVLFLLSAWDEDVLTIEHVLTTMTICGGIVVICRSFIPSENMVYCQNFLMKQIVANIHYAPKSWLEQAHSTAVYNEFSQLFHLKIQCLFEELISPIITPFVLYFWIRPNAYEIVLFFHNNTRSVEGFGDVCSYALMDISVDGDSQLISLNDSLIANLNNDSKNQNFKRKPNFCGKIEMSLLNFATLNPSWKPSPLYAEFIQRVKDMVSKELSNNSGCSLLQNSLLEMELENCNPGIFEYSLQNFKNKTKSDKNSKEGTLNDLESTLQPLSSANLENLSINDTIKNSTVIEKLNQNPLNSMIASLSNNSFLTSFSNNCTLSVLLQPKNIQEHSTRVLEMSFNALALNQLIASNRAFNQSGITSNVQRRNTHGYGAVSVLNNQRNVNFNVISYGSVLNSRYSNGPTNNIAGSNLWSVPEINQPLLSEDDSGDIEMSTNAL